MFSLLRSKAKFLYWFIAVTFILFMGLTNMGGRGCQSSMQQGAESGIVGTVNGASIFAQEYDQFYRQLLTQMRQQSPSRDLNPNQYASAQQRAWDGLVRSRIIEEAIAELNVTVSDNEIINRFENNPPPQLLANFRDPETGQVDMDRYYSDLQNPDVDWSAVEAWMSNLMRSEKLQQVVTSDVTVSDDDVRQEYINQTSKATAEYVGAIYKDFKEQYTPTEDEIISWYRSHQDDYQHLAKASCDIVRFTKEASDADYAEIFEFMNEIRQEILSSQKTFEEAAAEYSDDGSASRGGDLGTFDRNRMVDKFTEAAFELPVGELSEPVKTRFGYHLIEVLERHADEESGEIFQIHARHILLKVTPSNETLSLISEAAQGFVDRVDGSSFLSTASAEGMDLVQPDPFIAGRDIPGLSLSLAGSMWVHASESGQISRIFETNDFFYVVLAGETISAGTSDLEEVRGQVSAAVTRDHNHQTGLELLNPVIGEIQMGKAMAEAATGTDLTYVATDTFGVNDNIPNVGYGTDFNKLAIAGPVGTLIPDLETQRGVFALIPTWILPVDESEYITRQPGIQASLLERKQSEYLEDWLSAREDAATIEDSRFSLR